MGDWEAGATATGTEGCLIVSADWLTSLRCIGPSLDNSGAADLGEYHHRHHHLLHRISSVYVGRPPLPFRLKYGLARRQHKPEAWAIQFRISGSTFWVRLLGLDGLKLTGPFGGPASATSL